MLGKNKKTILESLFNFYQTDRAGFSIFFIVSVVKESSCGNSIIDENTLLLIHTAIKKIEDKI